MNKEKAIEKLREDEHYYGAFGKKYLSNSDISTLLTNPLALGKASEARPAFLVGGYFTRPVSYTHLTLPTNREV